MKAAASPTSDGSTEMTMAKALTAGLRMALHEDEKVVLMGEDIAALGGVFRVTEGLMAEFGAERVLDTPLGESGILGVALGLALRGYRPVCEIQFDGFVFPAFNQITTQLAKIHSRSRGTLTAPVVVRLPYGGAVGSIEHHSESPEAYFTHTPGVRVITPSNPHDAYWMVQQAVQCPDPVIVLEPKRRYWGKGTVNLSESGGGAFRAAVVRAGVDATVVAYGPLVAVALAAAEVAASEGRRVEVIDARSLSPLDMDVIDSSVRKTGRLVVAHEAPVFGGLGGEIAARVTEHMFYSLRSPVMRVGGFHMPYPVSALEEHYVPDIDRILDALDRTWDY